MTNPKLKILIVNDFSAIRRIVRISLNQLGYTNIEEVDDGKKALALLKSSKFDLVISDWNIPNMTGLELLQATLADVNLRDTKFLVVTAGIQQINMVAAVQAGGNNCISRPVTYSKLKIMIDRVMGISNL